jgi:hypothetical protein
MKLQPENDAGNNFEIIQKIEVGEVAFEGENVK